MSHLLLHRLRQTLRALAVHIALALTLLARLTLLVLAETAVLELFEQFVEAVAQGLLALCTLGDINEIIECL